MPVLLHLGRERAAARHLARRIGEPGDRAGQEGQQPVPFDRRVAARRAVIEQLLVLDEQETGDDQRRDRGEVREDALGLRSGERDRALMVQQR